MKSDHLPPQLSRKFAKISGGGMLLLLLAGCELVQTEPTPVAAPPTETAPEPAPEAPKKENEVDRLLREATVAFREKRLTTPVDDNAYYRYLRVLTIDPENERAETGIANIVDKYLEWAITHAEGQQFREANYYLNKARSVDHSHPNIAAVERRLAELRSANRTTYRLSPTEIGNKSPQAVKELHQIGRKITRHDARVLIVGRSDAEGRWVYQQLNEATPKRVRAEFTAGRHPMVRLIY